MKKYIQEVGRELNVAEIHFIERLSEENWTYIKTVINIVREPVLILDKDLRVMAANESFYRMFQVDQTNTEHALVYELGNGQWNIPTLRKLLEEILPQNKFFKDFEVMHDFPVIGEKSMLLNARQIHFTENTSPELFPPIILLAIEDITPMMAVAETLALHVKELAAQNAENTLRLERYIDTLEKEIRETKEGLKTPHK
jgi:nitrogen-specific signal transduction histidine kinase